MTRTQKVLGLALLVAALAMSALASSGANATNDTPEFTSDGDFVTVEGETTSGTDQEFVIGSSSITCQKVDFHGEASGTAATHSNAFTITPTYTPPCKTNTLPATVTMNGCVYVFHITGTEPPEGNDAYLGTVDLVCPAGKVVEIHDYATAATHKSNTSICTFTIAEQNGLGGITYKTDTGPPHTITVSGTVNLTATVHRNSILCPGTCTPFPCEAKNVAAKYIFNNALKLKGTNSAKEETSIWIG